jgi:bacterioferritin (cytochrome b1)
MIPNKLDKGAVDLLAPRHLDEMDAFYFYRAASNWCQGVGYIKAAAFFAAESEDELGHAGKIEKYLVDWNITVPLPTVPKPQVEFSGLLEILEEAYKIEYNLYEAYEETSKKMFNVDLCTCAWSGLRASGHAADTLRGERAQPAKQGAPQATSKGTNIANN